jgi:hypothetical protein
MKAEELVKFWDGVKASQLAMASNGLSDYMPPSASDNLFKLFRGIENDVVKSLEGQDIKVEAKTIDECLKLYSFFLDCLLTKEISSRLKDVIVGSIVVIGYWNFSFAKSDQLDAQMKYVDRVLRMHMSVLDAIQLLKIATLKFQPLINYTPPAFDLSRHHLEALNERIAKMQGEE